MQKADSNLSDGTAADSGQKGENMHVSQHSRKPSVVGSQMSSHNNKYKGLFESNATQENYWMKYPKSDTPNSEIGEVEKVSENEFGVQYKLVNRS